MDGTVTISLKEYHKFLNFEKAIHELEKKEGIVVLRAGWLDLPEVTVLGAPEATKQVVMALTEKIENLTKELNEYRSKNKKKRSSWFMGRPYPDI